MGITLEGVERDVLAWDYFSVISGEATREGVAAAGPVPVSFTSLSAYSMVRARSIFIRPINVVLRVALLLQYSDACCCDNLTPEGIL